MSSFYVGYGKQAERFKGVRHGYLPDWEPKEVSEEPRPTIESMDELVQKIDALIRTQAELEQTDFTYIPPTKPNNEAF